MLEPGIENYEKLHPFIELKDLHGMLRLLAIQKCDFILCFRQELRESVNIQ